MILLDQIPSISSTLEIIKVKVMWPLSDDITLLRILMNMFNCSTGWNKIQFILDDNEADFIFIINAIRPNLKIDYSKTIFIQTIPNLNILPESLRQFDFSKFLKVMTYQEMNDLGNGFISFYNLKLLSHPPKEKDLSCIISKNYIQRGDTEKIDFITYLEQKGLDFDIFGESLFPLQNLKENIDNFNQEKGLYKYKYSIITENNFHPNFYSEKILDSILSETVAFYYGCPNLERWIDEKCFIRLELSDYSKDMKKIKESITNNEWEKRIEFIRKEKERIITSFNLLASIENIIKYL
jgi:hypothetical protein